MALVHMLRRTILAERGFKPWWMRCAGTIWATFCTGTMQDVRVIHLAATRYRSEEA